ncbi:hypothetical protein ACFOHQ_00910 [Xanthomonas fragariae]
MIERTTRHGDNAMTRDAATALDQNVNAYYAATSSQPIGLNNVVL